MQFIIWLFHNWFSLSFRFVVCLSCVSLITGQAFLAGSTIFGAVVGVGIGAIAQYYFSEPTHDDPSRKEW